MREISNQVYLCWYFQVQPILFKDSAKELFPQMPGYALLIFNQFRQSAYVILAPFAMIGFQSPAFLHYKYSLKIVYVTNNHYFCKAPELQILFF